MANTSRVSSLLIIQHTGAKIISITYLWAPPIIRCKKRWVFFFLYFFKKSLLKSRIWISTPGARPEILHFWIVPRWYLLGSHWGNEGSESWWNWYITTHLALILESGTLCDCKAYTFNKRSASHRLQASLWHSQAKWVQCCLGPSSFKLPKAKLGWLWPRQSALRTSSIYFQVTF